MLNTINTFGHYRYCSTVDTTPLIQKASIESYGHIAITGVYFGEGHGMTLQLVVTVGLVKYTIIATGDDVIPINHDDAR